MNFQSRDSHSSPLFKSNHVLKLEDKILIENILFINKLFNNLLPPIFKSCSIFCSDVYNYQTLSSTAYKIFKPSYRTDSYGKNPITIGAINSWNKTQHQFSNLSLKTFSPTKIKSLLFKKMHSKLLMKKLKVVNLITQIKIYCNWIYSCSQKGPSINSVLSIRSFVCPSIHPSVHSSITLISQDPRARSF